MIKRGTRIDLSIYASHLCEDFYPEPHVFKPERFLKENTDNLIPYTFRPFGGNEHSYNLTIIDCELCNFILTLYFISLNHKESEQKLEDLGCALDSGFPRLCCALPWSNFCPGIGWWQLRRQSSNSTKENGFSSLTQK